MCFSLQGGQGEEPRKSPSGTLKKVGILGGGGV